ncbi:MAG: hypothetical protein ACFFDT_03150 [Candidatus Hodarchaeota archaeon]
MFKMILLICISSGIIVYYSGIKQSKWSLITILSGFLWVSLSLIWRMPLYLQGPFDIGFLPRSMVADDNHLSVYLMNDPILPLLLLASSLVFLVFFYSYDMLVFSENLDFQANVSEINIGTFYGLANLLGYILIMLFFSSPATIDGNIIYTSPLWLAQLGIFIKQIVTPILGMRTSKKYKGFLFQKESLKPTIFLLPDHIFPWLKNIWSIPKKVQMLPSKRVGSIIGGIVIILFFFPFSSFFIQHLTPKPAINGPYIYRNYENGEALAALQYLESISISDVTGSPEEFSMDNETLFYFLDRLSRGISIEGSSFKPYSYKFIWNVSIETPQFSILNQTTIRINWFDSEVTYFTWWENSTQYHLTYPENAENLNETAFSSYTTSVRWVYFGWFEYSEVFGSLGAHFIEVKQLIYLSEDHEILCVAYSQEHAVA